jgi:hypothetical protein
MELPRGRVNVRRLMVWAAVAAVCLAITRTYLLAVRNMHRQGRLRWYRETEKGRTLTKSEADDAERLAEELSQEAR